MSDFPAIEPIGERGILVDFRPEIKEDLLKKLLDLKKFLQGKLLKEGVEVINTFNSLLISYRFTIKDIDSEVLRIKDLVEKADTQNKNQQYLFHVPVCYEEDFAPDLEFLSAEKKLSQKELISFHTAPVYTVYFIGFLPGFLYLGGLDQRLHFPRREQPRLKVEKGAVGIGGIQTGIYPKTSPGGWQIIGNSPVPLFDQNKLPPCEFSPGDKLKFYAIDIKEYRKISEEVREGSFRIKKENYVG